MAHKQEQGYTGLIEYNGIIQEDFLKEMRGKEAYKRFNEMRLNDATIGAGLLAIEYMLRSMSWEFTSEEEDDPWLEFVQEARENMRQSWNDIISEIVSFVWAGYSLTEIVYERDERGRLLWRKFAPRGQDTVFKWEIDEHGGLTGVTQMGAPTYKLTMIPIEYLLIFKTRSEKNNPEGRSLLRVAWKSYYYLKNLQAIEAIGFERDVTGMPVIKLPQNASVDENDTNSDASKAAKIVRNMRNDEQAGLVLPFGWDAVLLSGTGKSFAALSDAIKRYESRIATTFFSQFLMLGQDGVGSLALSSTVMDFFLSSVNAIADIIGETIEKYAVPRLIMMNGGTKDDANRIRLEHTPATNVDLEKFGAVFNALKDVLTLDAGDEVWLRQMLGMPERDEEQLIAEREQKQAQKEQALAAFRERMNQDQDDEQPQDNMTIFAADAPDKDIRLKFEKEWKKVITPMLEATRKRLRREARNAAK